MKSTDMRSLSEKLSVPALALAVGIEACAPVEPPKSPEPIVVDIPSAMAVASEELPDANVETYKGPGKEKCEGPLTIERIMNDAPGRDADEIDKEIDSYRGKYSRRNKRGWEITNACRSSERASECTELRWKEHERVRRDNVESFYRCDQLKDPAALHECVMQTAWKDDQLRAVKAYCSQMILDCVESEFSK